MTRPRTAAIAILALTLTTAGCVGTKLGTPTAKPPPGVSVDVPDEPIDSPERPAVVNESSVREYVHALEYSVADNSLWMNEYTDVTLACRVDSVSERPWGYEAVVTCTGYSNTDVSVNATHRHPVEPRTPVS